MSPKPNHLATDLRGAANLAIDAVLGITHIVESLHRTIAGAALATATTDPSRPSGITGLVYSNVRTVTENVRTVTELVGSGIDVSLDLMGATLRETESSTGREAALAALNGVLGDHLVARKNPLAIPMQLRRAGKPMNEQALRETIEQSSGKLAIMVHGLCMNDLQWQRQGHDHGAALARDLGIAPVYLHYNTGLHTSENGRSLANLLESVVALAPNPLELVIITHSMGGLVARSACHYGELSAHSWPNQLRKLLFLGTPQHGALLEKGGHWIDFILETNPYSAPFSRLGKIRSAGITDLRYGNVIEADWQGQDPVEFAGDRRVPVPLPQGVDCYAIAATTGKEANGRLTDLVGDGFVTLDSALGRHKKAELTLLFPDTRQWVGRNMNHFDLLSHPEVYETIRGWMSTTPPLGLHLPVKRASSSV